DQIMTIPVTLEQWRFFKKKANEGWSQSSLVGTQLKREKAIACLFLNRTSYSGIMTPVAGPIGGKNQASNYKVDCRFPRETLVKRVKQAGGLRGRVSFVWNWSWTRALTTIHRQQGEGKLPNNLIYYFDPPFFHKAEGLYTYYF